MMVLLLQKPTPKQRELKRHLKIPNTYSVLNVSLSPAHSIPRQTHQKYTIPLVLAEMASNASREFDAISIGAQHQVNIFLQRNFNSCGDKIKGLYRLFEQDEKDRYLPFDDTP